MVPGQPIQQRLRIGAAKADRQDVRPCRQPTLLAASGGTFQQLFALTGGVGEDQTTLMQSPQEGLDLFERESKGSKAFLEAGLDLGEAGAAVEHFQDRVLFFAQVEIIQRHRVFDKPIALPPVVLRHDRQVGPAPQEERPFGSRIIML